MMPITIPAISKQTATIIFLHGLGDSGHAWSEILQALRPPFVKLICPNAPEIPITINGGSKLRGWFDLRPLDQPKDVGGIQQSSKVLQSLVQKEIDAGIPSTRILLGGFSQGGALALYTGLTGSIQLPGILALSTWLPLEKSIEWNRIQKPKILQCHGENDNMVSIVRAKKTAQLLQSKLSSYKFNEYAGLGHTIDNEQELKDIRSFIQEVLPPALESSKL